MQVSLINFQIIIPIIYCVIKKSSINVFLKLIKSPSLKGFSQNFQASWNLVGNSCFGEQLVRYSSQQRALIVTSGIK